MRCGGSVGGVVVAQLMELWWLSWCRCGGSVGGRVLAQLVEVGRTS